MALAVTLVVEPDSFVCRWEDGRRQSHATPHRDFWDILRAVRAAGSAFRAGAVASATGQPAYRVYDAWRWLVSIRAVRRRKGVCWISPSGFERTVTAAWFGIEADDLPDGAEGEFFPSTTPKDKSQS